MTRLEETVREAINSLDEHREATYTEHMCMHCEEEAEKVQLVLHDAIKYIEEHCDYA